MYKKKYEKTKVYECQYCKIKINYDENLPFIRYIDILYFFGINIPNNNNYESNCNENNDMNKGLNNYDFYEDSINYYYCEEHNSEIIYYCVDCNKKLCGYAFLLIIMKRKIKIILIMKIIMFIN